MGFNFVVVQGKDVLPPLSKEFPKSALKVRLVSPDVVYQSLKVNNESLAESFFLAMTEAYATIEEGRMYLDFWDNSVILKSVPNPIYKSMFIRKWILNTFTTSKDGVYWKYSAHFLKQILGFPKLYFQLCVRILNNTFNFVSGSHKRNSV
ncbi:hypothetical protein NPIL_181561 [Nephila pilipes]|uniref:Uncharacterized protein n=1 Tax=Nephila pilipes TaxID=299642 RepID=A0A8X6PIQ4_NEPPI|nr:hypothetical protein NPIL_181561 [Nephila pilipes]